MRRLLWTQLMEKLMKEMNTKHHDLSKALLNVNHHYLYILYLEIYPLMYNNSAF